MRGRRKSHQLPLRALPCWLIDQFNDRAALIIVCMAALAVAALALFLSSVVSRGPLPTARVEGRIVGVGFVDIQGRGSVPEASIEAEGYTLRIQIPARLDCRVGDVIALTRISPGKRPYFILAPIPDPCRRTT